METVVKLKHRLLSLDFFRGLTVMAMILVNNPGSWGHIYAPLEHAEWNGCTPTDLIFPFFLFMVGVSIVFAMQKAKDDPALHSKLIGKAFRRALTLYALQVFSAVIFVVWKDPIGTFAHLRIPGVLARIAAVYFICSVLYLKAGRRTLLVLIPTVLLGYWALMTLVPVPGLGYATLEKGKNLAAWVDRTILGENHLWKFAKTWDPEGILSTLPAIGTCLIGVITGIYLKNADVLPNRKARAMAVAGVVLLVVGLLWNVVFPINKSLWTSSYVLYSAGWALLLFGLSYWMIDVKGWKWFTLPFVVYGVNAITVFFLSGLLPRFLNLFKVAGSNGKPMGAYSWYYEYLIKPHFAPKDASLVSALSVVLFFFVIMYVLYRRRIFLKV